MRNNFQKKVDLLEDDYMTLPTIPRVDYHGVRAEIGKLVSRLLKQFR